MATSYAELPTFRGIPVVDVDTHISEWADLWTSRAPARYKDRVPTIKQIDGYHAWVIDGDKWLGGYGPNSTVRRDGSKAGRFEEFTRFSLDDVHPASFDVHARLDYMNESSIAVQVAYPNVLGFGGQKASEVDADLRLVSTQIYNDAMAELQEQSGNRILPMALMPWWDIKLMVKEIERCHAMGLRGINTNSDPHTHNLPDLSHEYWYPVWEICSDLGLPVNFHIGASDESSTWFGSGAWPTHGSDKLLAYGSTMMFLSNSRVLSNVILSLMLERFPKLKMVSVESGVGWIPFLLEALEYQMQEAGIKYNVPPSEIFERQIYACSWFERKGLVKDSRLLGINNVMFETDFPHPTCLYPDPLQNLGTFIDEFTPDELSKVMSGNAAKVYNIDFNR